MKSVIYFVNYSCANKNRSVECRLFSKLKDAKEFIKDKHGYIVRQGGHTMKLIYKNNFDPSATEVKKIESICKLSWDEVCEFFGE